MQKDTAQRQTSQCQTKANAKDKAKDKAKARAKAKAKVKVEAKAKAKAKQKRQKDEQTDGRTDGRTGRQGQRQPDRQTDRDTDRDTDRHRQAGRHTGRQADRQRDGRMEGRTDGPRMDVDIRNNQTFHSKQWPPYPQISMLLLKMSAQANVLYIQSRPKHKLQFGISTLKFGVRGVKGVWGVLGCGVSKGCGVWVHQLYNSKTGSERILLPAPPPTPHNPLAEDGQQ